MFKSERVSSRGDSQLFLTNLSKTVKERLAMKQMWHIILSFFLFILVLAFMMIYSPGLTGI